MIPKPISELNSALRAAEPRSGLPWPVIYMTPEMITPIVAAKPPIRSKISITARPIGKRLSGKIKSGWHWPRAS